jgi:hypothetical protein
MTTLCLVYLVGFRRILLVALVLMAVAIGLRHWHRADSNAVRPAPRHSVPADPRHAVPAASAGRAAGD